MEPFMVAGTKRKIRGRPSCTRGTPGFAYPGRSGVAPPSTLSPDSDYLLAPPEVCFGMKFTAERAKSLTRRYARFTQCAQIGDALRMSLRQISLLVHQGLSGSTRVRYGEGPWCAIKARTVLRVNSKVVKEVTKSMSSESKNRV